MKYSGADSKITVTVSAGQDVVTIGVKDEGIGIEEADLPHIFSVFFRSDNEGTRSQSGMGVGLYFCRQIVDHHHGEISVDSEVGRGTTMTLSLPREFQEQSADNESPAA